MALTNNQPTDETGQREFIADTDVVTDLLRATLAKGNDLLPTFEAYAYNIDRDYPGVIVGL